MFSGLVPRLALRNLRSDWFATLCAVLGVALGTATVNVVLTLDVNTRAQEAGLWTTNPDLAPELERTVALRALHPDGTPKEGERDAKTETHEDYQVMRSAIRLGSLSAFLVGALIVFFTFRVVVVQRRREIALLRSLGASARQVAGIFVLEALIIGVVGALLGFVMAAPLSIAAAFAGITTTGRSNLYWLFFPWKLMAAVSVIGAVTAVLGILRPLREVLRLDVARTLRPQFLTGEDAARQRPRGLTVIALPFMALLYISLRPFFTEVLPSLAFFVLEAGLVCAAFLGMLVLVPQLVSALGGAIARLFPDVPSAARTLTQRRIERAGHELAWSVSGVMLVFALLLALHVVTHALQREVTAWAEAGWVRPNAYVIVRDRLETIPESVLAGLDPEVLQVRLTGRSPWPNSLMAVKPAELRALAELTGPEEAALARRFGVGKVIVSQLFARRFRLEPGDTLLVESRARTARLEVVGISEIGYVPMVGPYRDSKTFGLIAEEDGDLIAPYARPRGAGMILRHPAGEQAESFWAPVFSQVRRVRGLWAETGRGFEDYRTRETNRDFAIFDVILLLTGVLAGVGIANSLVLSAHVRRRELALYRVLGMSTGQIQRMFLLEGTFIGLLGGLMAVALGVPLGYAAIGALRVVSAFDVRFELPAAYMGLTICGALIISLAASLYPAVRASRLDGAESVQYE